jgi:hypothetical protein
MSEINETVHAVAAIVARSRRVRANIEKAREALQLYRPGDNTPLTFKRAICHPLLGGVLRKDENKDVPGPSFTVNSLRRAADKSELPTFWHGTNQFVTPAGIQQWLAKSTSGRKKPAPLANNDYVPPAQRTRYEKTLDDQAMDRVNDAFASIDAMLSKQKSKKKKGR